MKNSLMICFILLLTSSCLIQGPDNNRRVSKFNLDNPDNGSEPVKSPDFSILGDRSWFSNELKGLSITLQGDTDTSISLRGKQIHNFLKENNNDFSKNYCIVFHRFDDIKAAKQLRLRALPSSTIDFANQTRELSFRIELQDESGSSEICGGTLVERNPNASTGTVSYTSNPTSDSTVAFALNKLCFNDDCISTDLLTSTSVFIYESKSGTVNDADIIPQSVISSSFLSVKAGYTTTINNNATFCEANNNCKEQNLDCCNDNTCVRDGSTKPNAQADFPEDYAQAQIDVGFIPERYKSWPNIFNICVN